MSLNPRREKKCCICRSVFAPSNSTQKVCSIPCAMKLQSINAEKALAKERRRENRERAKRKRDSKPLSYFEELAQRHFNAFIRVRDHGLPCISCDKSRPPTCGHHRTVAAAPELRYNTKNANGQCMACNKGSARFRKNEGTILKRYEQGVVERFGTARLEYVYSPHQAKRYRRKDLERIASIFRRRAKIYERNRENRGHRGYR